jgi:hypothetical protein
LFTWVTSLPIFIRNNNGLIEEIIGYSTIFWLLILLIICAIFVFPIAIPVLLVMFLVSLSFILYKGTIIGNIKDGVNGPVGAGDILTGFLEIYPKTLILFLCLYVISIFFKNLGLVAGFVSIVISILILYFMDKLIEYYKNPSLNMSQILGKSSTDAPKSEAPAPKSEAPTPPAAKVTKATKGGGNFDLLKELKKLQ